MQKFNLNFIKFKHESNVTLASVLSRDALEKNVETAPPVKMVSLGNAKKKLVHL